MKSMIISIIFLSALILSACGGVTLYSTPIISSSTITFPTITPLPMLAGTPTIKPTLENTPAPETLYGYPTPEIVEPPTCAPGMDCLAVTPNVQRQDFNFHDLYVGKYISRNWCNNDPRFNLFPYCAVTISSMGSKQIEIWGWPAYFEQETGAELTGRGKPDIVVIDWPDGNCCARVVIYEAGDNLKKIMDVGTHWLGTFTDLNGDGTYEYIANERIWLPFNCLCEVFMKVIYEYQGYLGYVPATYKFKNKLQFNIDIQKNLEALSSHNKQYPNTFLRFDDQNLANTNTDYDYAVGRLYNIVVDYLLMNQKSDVMKILNEYCPSKKVS